MKNAVSEAKLLPILDGLDELDSIYQEPCIHKINIFLRNIRPLKIVVCSRWEEYIHCQTELYLNEAIYLMPLNDLQIKEHLSSLNCTDILQIIDNDPSLLELVRTPLSLTIAILTYSEDFSDRWLNLTTSQERLQYLLDAYIKRMFERKVRNEIYSPQKVPTSDQKNQWLTRLACQLNKSSETEFEIEKVQPSLFLSKVQAKQYKAYVILFSTTLSIFLSGLVGIIIGPMIGMVISEDMTINTYEKMAWSWKAFFWGFGIATILFSVVMIVEQDYNEISSLIVSLIIILDFSLIIGFVSGRKRQPEVGIKNSPNQGIFRTLRNSFAIFLLTSLTMITGSIAVLLVTGRFPSMNDCVSMTLFAASVGCISSLFQGGQSCIRHLALRVTLYQNKLAPWNYAKFLNYCTDHALLQRIGGRYRFVHRFLQEHFAAMPLKK